MKKTNLSLCILCFLLILTSCTNFEKNNDISKATYLLASTEQFGGSSELVGLTENGELCYKIKLDFGGITCIKNEEQYVNIYTYDSSYKLNKKDNKVEELKVDISVPGSAYRNSVTSNGNDYFYPINQGFGETYYKNAILKNDKEFINVEGTVMTNGFKNDVIYFVYTHTESMTAGVSDYKLQSNDIETAKRLGVIDLPLLSQYSFIAGMIYGDFYYLYAYIGHDSRDTSSVFVKVNLENGEYEEIPLDENTETILSKRLNSIITMNNWFQVGNKLYFIQESNNYLEWDTETDTITAKNFEQYNDDTSSLYKMTKDASFIRLGYENDNLCLFTYDLDKGSVLNKVNVKYQAPNYQVVYDFVLLK